MSPRSSRGPAGSTSDLNGPGCGSSASAKPTRGDDGCSPPGSPASPAPTTYAMSENQRAGTERGYPLIWSAAASPARTGPSPADEPGSRPASGPGCSSTGATGSQSSLFDQPGCCSRTSRDFSPLTTDGTSGSSFARWPTSGMASAGGYSTLDTSECPSDAGECSLSDILEATPDPRLSLSPRAASGILRRAAARGRTLPPALEAALNSLACAADASTAKRNSSS